MTQDEFNERMENYLAQYLDGGYVTLTYSGEEVQTLLTRMDQGTVIIPSSTAGSTKKFRVQVDDTGLLSALEVT